MPYVSVVLLHPSLVHHERVFTYSLPDGVSAPVGTLVRVPVRGRPYDAVVVDELDAPDVARTVSVRRVLGPGLDAATVALCRWVAEQYLSTTAEAIAAALPQRVASEEKADPAPASTVDAGDLAWLREHRNGPRLLAALEAGRHGGFLLETTQGADRAAMIASLVTATAAAGRGVLVLLPEVRFSSDTAETLRAIDGVAWLGSDRPARARYRAWLDLREGSKRIGAGGRAAAFAPATRLGLVIVDDEANVSYKERRAPRFHARAVASERARRAGAVFVAVGSPPSVEAYAAVQRKTLTRIWAPHHAQRRDRVPVVVVPAERLTPAGRTLALAAQTLKAGKRVAIVTHRAGEHAAKAFERARRVLSPKRPALLDASTPRAELRRALRVADLIVATPVIAKDVRPERIGLVAVCDADAALASAEFRAAEEAFAVWWSAGRWAGRVAIETAQPEHPAVRGLVRWDPNVLLAAEAARRAELGYPPFAGLARIDLPAEIAPDVAKQIAEAIPTATILGPAGEGDDAVLAVRMQRRAQLIEALAPLASAWRRDAAPVRVDIDPRELLP